MENHIEDETYGSDEELLLKGDPPSPERADSVEESTGHWGYVVPLLILYVVSGMPVMTIFTQYIYKKVQEEMNVTLDLGGNNSSRGCNVNYTDPNYILQQSVQAEAANWAMYIHLAHFPISLVMTVTYGIYSDHLGRRITFILPPIGSMASCIVMMAMLTFDLPIWWFFFMGVEYLFGGMFTLFTGCFSYVADTSVPEKRAMHMTILDALLLLSAAVAELFVGVWIKYGGFLPPLYFVLVGKLACLVFAIFFIPETIKTRTVEKTISFVKGSSTSQMTQTKKPRLSLKDMKHGFLLFFHDNGTGRRWKMNILLLSYVLASIFGVYHITTLFELNSPLCWDSVFIGYFGSLSMGVKFAVTLLGALVLRRYLSEAWIAVIARTQTVASNLYIAFVTSTIMMFFTPIMGAMSLLAIPMTRAIMSNLVNKHEQGAMFAVMTCAENFASLISTLSVNKIYASTLLFYEGFVFLVGTVVSFLSLTCLLYYIWRLAREKKMQQRKELLTVT